VIVGSIVLPGPASAGGLGLPSSGSTGPGGYFLSCRATSSKASTARYYDQQGVLKTWDCGLGKRPHLGVDIMGSRTPGVTPVFASAAGTVVSAERGSGLGWRVIMRHDGLGPAGMILWTIYAHMGVCRTGQSLIDPGIRKGSTISAGTLLGYQGDDTWPGGCGVSPHLHWELHANPTSLKSVFSAPLASPDYFVGLPLTADDPAPAKRVSASWSAPNGPGVVLPTSASPAPQTSVKPPSATKPTASAAPVTLGPFTLPPLPSWPPKNLGANWQSFGPKPTPKR
jgi:murein DD-endopeptidase MepM/ murein hydrolase activator NlpD